MRREYNGLIMKLVEFYFLIALVTQSISSYPYGDAIRFINNESYLEERPLRDADVSIRMRTRKQHNQDLPDRERIVFPEEGVPSCRGLTYCEKVDSYPKDLVTKALQRNDSLRYLAGVDVIPDLVQRLDASDVPLCVSTENVIFPQSAETKDNEWKFVANQDNFKQGVRIEKCVIRENNSCSVIGGVAEGYKTSCKQKYVYRQLAAVLTDGSVVPETFRFPSSCCCHVRFVGDPMTRMGLSGFGAPKSQVTPVKTRKRK